ncbi:hypothetical protein KM92DES2_11143 [uncultured Desulfovibrio sp.]|uniref:Uncharacterized protein n=1 Tax=uncultured Desulfovibrio sp. TaxID=167968 RepID=A0A212JHW7_9BACT|nr:hypothetical protein KM92DES2_11143 [uncultured Desulfovibrio sp.]
MQVISIAATMQQLRCLTRRTYANTYIAQGKPDPGQNQQTGAPRAANRAKSAPRPLRHAAHERTGRAHSADHCRY